MCLRFVICDMGLILCNIENFVAKKYHKVSRFMSEDKN